MLSFYRPSVNRLRSAVLSLVSVQEAFCFSFFHVFIYLLLAVLCRSLLLCGLFLRDCPLVSRASGFSCGAQALGAQASVEAAHGLSCSEARGIFLDQGSNPCLLRWQVDSLPGKPSANILAPFVLCEKFSCVHC